MATKIFRPRRGKASSMSTTVLAKGEMFFENINAGSTGVGPYAIKIGDGSTAYSSLNYAIGPQAASVFSTSSATSDSEALAELVSGNSYSTLFGAIKYLLTSLVNQVTTLNNEYKLFQESVGLMNYWSGVVYDCACFGFYNNVTGAADGNVGFHGLFNAQSFKRSGEGECIIFLYFSGLLVNPYYQNSSYTTCTDYGFNLARIIDICTENEPSISFTYYPMPDNCITTGHWLLDYTETTDCNDFAQNRSNVFYEEYSSGLSMYIFKFGRIYTTECNYGAWPISSMYPGYYHGRMIINATYE